MSWLTIDNGEHLVSELKGTYQGFDYVHSIHKRKVDMTKAVYARMDVAGRKVLYTGDTLSELTMPEVVKTLMADTRKAVKAHKALIKSRKTTSAHAHTLTPLEILAIFELMALDAQRKGVTLGNAELLNKIAQLRGEL